MAVGYNSAKAISDAGYKFSDTWSKIIDRQMEADRRAEQDAAVKAAAQRELDAEEGIKSLYQPIDEMEEVQEMEDVLQPQTFSLQPEYTPINQTMTPLREFQPEEPPNMSLLTKRQKITQKPTGRKITPQVTDEQIYALGNYGTKAFSNFMTARRQGETDEWRRNQGQQNIDIRQQNANTAEGRLNETINQNAKKNLFYEMSLKQKDNHFLKMLHYRYEDLKLKKEQLQYRMSIGEATQADIDDLKQKQEELRNDLSNEKFASFALNEQEKAELRNIVSELTFTGNQITKSIGKGGAKKPVTGTTKKEDNSDPMGLGL